MTEQEILKLIKSIIPNSKKYLYDDAAVIKFGNEKLVLTTDTFNEGTHFIYKKSIWSLDEIGYKALAINLSDIASMGAIPECALVALSLPTTFTKNDINTLYKGIQKCAKKHKTQIVGGNITKSKTLSITITLIGRAKINNLGTRSNAKPGDIVFASGTFGDSAAGYKLLSKKGKNALKLIHKHKKPNPRIELGHKICSASKRVSLMDSSDGLADCILQISKNSNVQINISKELIPMSKELLNAKTDFKLNPLQLSLYGGEDYELVGTASKKDWEKLSKLNKLKKIGNVTKGTGAFLIQSSNKRMSLDIKKTFQHFK